MSEISGTKEQIFDTFIEMISTLGYENVSMRDIAMKVGIKVPSIYNHFESKQKILDDVYDYYSIHYFDHRLPVEDMKEFITTASAYEIVRTFARTYESEDQKKYVRMILITKIVIMRLFQDTVANRMFSEHNNDDINYVIDVLEYGVKIGRISSDFDLLTFAEVLIDSYIMMGIKAFAGATYEVGQLDQEKRLINMLARLLSTALMST